MPKIGVVLSGCASKGAYEIGCLAAIDDYFGPGAITCVSSSSIGAMIGQLYGMGRKEGLIQAFRDMDSGKYGRYILAFTNNKTAVQALEKLLEAPNAPAYKHRLTADVVLSGINVVSKKYSKALSTREKVKAK